jgi:hypothetical protein
LDRCGIRHGGSGIHQFQFLQPLPGIVGPILRPIQGLAGPLAVHGILTEELNIQQRGVAFSGGEETVGGLTAESQNTAGEQQGFRGHGLLSFLSIVFFILHEKPPQVKPRMRVKKEGFFVEKPL